MELEMFNYINEVIRNFDKLYDELEIGSKEIELYFEKILEENNEGFLNITTRVKSSSSLREKIIRNQYYKKYSSAEELLLNLSDLIGVRIECRFVEDENNIYKVLKEYFNVKSEDGYFYNDKNKNIKLDLNGKQPQEQRNGFEIYRVDGVFILRDKCINFELQIKSLVNIFWGEIEHKVIYKNNNYILRDKFLKEMMWSVKKNLSMIDNQLLIIYDQFNKISSTDSETRKKNLEGVLSKIIYDIFSARMRESIGFVVDFKNSCDAIMQYIFRTNNAENIQEYNNTLINTFSRLNDIDKDQISFHNKIQLEREVIFDDQFSEIVGGKILSSLNKDFQWNLFFKILFEIELGNNAEDFESFIKYFKNVFYNNKSFKKIYLFFEKEEGEEIVNSIMKELAACFVKVDNISFIYDGNMKNINNIIDNTVKIILANVNTYEEWKNGEDIFLSLFSLKVLSIFDYKIETSKVKELIEKIKNSSTRIQISEGILKYIDKLEILSEITAKDALQLIRTNNIK
ncbi:relA/spoT family protein [Clostridium sp. MSJ-11]|uniref:RelA/spoT family protein n=1 Tax=Clostridium mobile TaxID=2841512 RepID=A0ABS6EER2_9CLOT|nr:relA/spoT family protein [Clostridium mobile]MBU5483191.1 relA/spoT family protein [Clostridium mobile]